MRRTTVWILASLLLMVSIGPLLAQETGTASVLQVIDSEPLAGQELGLDEPITLYFDRALDCATAEEALRLEPGINGTVTCNGAILILDPDTSYERASTYTLTISERLRGADGALLLEPYQIEFQTTGFLQVSEVFPAMDTADIPAQQTAITVIFNRPVVPLLTSADEMELPDPLALDPPVSGSGEWINTSIYVYNTDEPLVGSTTYVATVPAGLTAVDGSVLPRDFSWVFSTQLAEVTEYRPRDMGGSVLLDTPIQISFNQAMDRPSTEQAFFLRPEGVEFAEMVAGEFEWNDASTGFAFVPDDLLQIDTVYLAGFSSGVAQAANGGGSLLPVNWTFYTLPLPEIVSTYPTDGEQEARPFGGFEITFASPMDIDTLQDRITIVPAPEREPEYYWREWSNTYDVSFLPYPSTEYTVTIEPGMADLYGNTIDERRVITYTTAPYDPNVSLNTPGSVGLYNAYREPTALYLTHRNISQIDLELRQVDTERLIRSVAASGFYDVNEEMLFDGNEGVIRRWSIPSVAPENALRYELLDLAAVATGDNSVSCPGAPESRLKVGDLAIVITDPDPLRARETPVDGEIVDLLYRDYRAPVTDGPVCEVGLLWWEIELRDGRRAWVAEGTSDEYFVDVAEAGQATPVIIEAGEGEGTLPPGLYYLRATAPELVTRGWSPNRHILVVSTAVLTVKSSVDSVTVWATNVQTGEPMPDQPITIYNTNGREVGRGMTGADGIMQISLPRISDLYQQRMAVLDSGEHFGMGYSEWTSGIEPYFFDASYDFYPSRYRVYVYSDRPIYRPGQPVYFRGIVRERDDVSYTPPEQQTVPVTITDGNGEIVYERNLTLNEFGTFNDSFTIDSDAALGNYRISVEMPSEMRYRSEGGGVSFTVAEYRLPEFLVDVTAVEPEVVQGETVSARVESTYFFGGAVSDASVDYTVVTRPYNFNYTGPGFYSFRDFASDEGPREFYGDNFTEQIAEGEALTDAQGEYIISVPAELKDATRSQTFTIEAVVSDESNQAVAGRTEIVVHQSLVYVGVRPESYVSRAGDPARFEVITVDWDSEPVANQEVSIEIIERRWSSVQEQDERGRTTWTYEVENIPVTDGTIQSDSEGLAVFEFTPEDGGTYLARVTTRDSQGNTAIASTNLWVSSSQYVTWRQQNSNRIDLIADREDYSVGDTAELLITSPFQGTAEALITVERGDVISYERVMMDSNSFIYRLPITADFAPNVYVSVFIVKGVDENNPVASFRMGYTELSVDIDQKELTVEVSANVEQAQPQQTVTYTVNVMDYKGDPVRAEVGVGVTDLAALSLAPMNSGSLLSYFYSEQSLSIRTSTGLTINTDQLTQEVLDTIKGGGGGILGDGIVEIRGEFVDTPFWNASIVTGEDGEASFDVRLPDNLTTWRLDARAVTSGRDGLTLVGQTTFDLLSTKPLLIRPATPRFFVVGDQATLAAVVNNNTGSDQEAVLTLQATGLELGADAAQTVTVPAGGRVRVSWPVTVPDVPSITAAFTVDAGDFSDGAVSGVSLDEAGTLPVYKYEVPETVGTAGVLRSADTRVESILLPRRFDVTQGELTIKVDQSLAATTIDGLDYLENFPHQCTEQTVSRFLPNIVTVRALRDLGLSDPALEANLDDAVSFALQKLFAEQKNDGGWGWFVQDSSNPLTTAYALIGLYEAQQQGYPVSDEVLSRAQEYLRGSLQAVGPNVSTWVLNRQAFILYAMARTGASDVARSVTLFENRDRLSLYARAYLAETFYYIDPVDTRRSDTLVSELVNEAIISATGVHWDESLRDPYNWNTNTRTTAIILGALIRLRPDSDLLPNVVRYLIVQRTADAWETTQETAWAVMALTDWMRVSGELRPDYSYDVTLNGESLTSGDATPQTARERQELQIAVAELLKDEANTLAFSRSDGPGALYYTAHLRAFLPVPEVQALDRGIILQRRYTLLDDPDQTPVTEARVGDVVQVRLTIIVPNDLHYVMVEDPLPAGADAINPDLDTSQQVGTRPGLDNTNPLSRGWGWWWFSRIDFRDEKVVLYSTYLPAGTYEYVYSIRPGLEGVYNVIPVTGQEFYFPEVYGRSDGSTFTILPADS